MKQIIFLLCGFLTLTIACKKDTKQSQTIEFGGLAPQLLKDGSITLKATATSGLPVTFFSSNSNIVSVSDNTAIFKESGTVYITAKQAGDDTYYEAPQITQGLTILDWDENKLSQTITFDLPESWNNEQPLQLEATASSGLAVTFTSDNSLGTINESNQLILYHGTETWDAYINITASQQGNSEYNPATNVVKTIHALGTGTH